MEQLDSGNENKNKTINIRKLKLGKIDVAKAKLNRARRRKVLQCLAKEYNISKAADAVGVARTSLFNLIARDPEFAESVQTIHDYYLDQIEQVSVELAATLSPTTFNDRKLQLQAHRRAYQRTPETAIQVVVNSDNAIDIIRDTISGAIVSGVDDSD